MMTRRHIDGAVAGLLVKTASALRLLGAEAVITGVGGKVAQTLVQRGVAFGTVVTQASLESGIAYALARLGQRWARIPSSRGA